MTTVSGIVANGAQEEETFVNIQMLSDLFTELTRREVLSETAQDLVDILDSVQDWPPDVLEANAPMYAHTYFILCIYYSNILSNRMVGSFEEIFNKFEIGNENIFTRRSSSLAYTGRKVKVVQMHCRLLTAVDFCF